MNPYGQWIIVNCLVWSAALYTLALSIRFLGIAGLLIGSLFAGLLVGIAQAVLVRHSFPISPRNWAGSSALAGFLAILPLAILLIVWILLTLVTGLNAVLFIMGAIFGGILGGIQARLLYPLVFEKSLWWVGANLLAGAFCAPLSLTGTSFWLPVLCSLGPLTFGLITALALAYLQRALD